MYKLCNLKKIIHIHVQTKTALFQDVSLLFLKYSERKIDFVFIIKSFSALHVLFYFIVSAMSRSWGTFEKHARGKKTDRNEA